MDHTSPMFQNLVGLLVTFVLGFLCHAVIGGALDLLDKRRFAKVQRLSQADLDRAKADDQAVKDYERAREAVRSFHSSAKGEFRPS